MPPRPVGAVLRCAAVLLAVALIVTGCGPAAPAGDPAVVRTSDGAVRGVLGSSDGLGFRLFQGIPYAAAPVGPLRWQPPVPPPRWNAVRDATKPGLRCVQDTRADPDFGRPTGEDCLNLTVWTPSAATPADRRPVMVWIHGGGFLNGSSDIYNARWLATRGDIVVVAVNYRLGALGFLAHPALTGSGGQAPGNYGLADQQAALRWVRDNVAAFGGDPDRVTIAGESAGAISVCDHMVAPESTGLFRAAIMQSGPCQAQAPLPAAEKISVDYAARAGCPDRPAVQQCLRDLPADRLITGPPYVRIGANILTGPVTGTQRLPADPPTVADSGPIARVPVLIGSTADEFTLFVALTYLRHRRLPPYRTLLKDTFGTQAPAVAARYPLTRYDGSNWLAYAAAVTDGIFACPIEGLAAGLAKHAPVYAYEFNDRHAPAPEPLQHMPFAAGAAHALELRYLFDLGGAPPLDPAQRRLSDQMIAYWSRFVTTGAPGVDGLPAWPALNPEAPQQMSLQPGSPVLTADFTARHQCGFWSSLG
ncbi:MAG: carboxylesterase/lipase family protein [Mycobacterium sp.]